MSLGQPQIEQFIEEGFLRLDDAFPLELAEEGCRLLSRDLPCDLRNPATWTYPVVRLPGYGGPPFEQAANTPALHAAFDALVGAGRWKPLRGLGTFPVRFPHPDDAGDTGWHVDASFPPPPEVASPHDYSGWRVNIHSRGRGLLLLFLFSGVGEEDAPTRIRVGSHRDIARLLAPAGEAGLAPGNLDHVGTGREIALATGPAGTVYLCHPFLIHAAQRHRGRTPRFLAQPPLELREPYQLERPDAAYSAVEVAIRRALAGA